MSRKVTFKGNTPGIDSCDMTADNNTSPATDSSPYRFEINVLELARMVFEKRRLVVGFSMIITVLTAVYLFLQPNLYTSTATILPSGNSGGISDLKSLVGLGSGFSNIDENSSALYPVVLNSNLVVDAVLDEKYSFVHDNEPMSLTLVEFFDIGDRDRLRAALRDITTVRSDNQTGEIYVGVETRYPELSRAVLTNYLAQLEDFNSNKRRSSARDNEKYLGRQTAAVKEELRSAEDKLEAFQLTNLDWAMTGSPEVLKELGRLQRDVESKTATYALLMQQYEMAKLETQKDIPIVRILDAPSLPTMKSGPFRRNMILLAGFISFALTVLALIVRHLMRQLTTVNGREDYDALRHDFQNAFPRTRTTINRLKTSVLEKTPLFKS